MSDRRIRTAIEISAIVALVAAAAWVCDAAYKPADVAHYGFTAIVTTDGNHVDANNPLQVQIAGAGTLATETTLAAANSTLTSTTPRDRFTGAARDKVTTRSM